MGREVWEILEKVLDLSDPLNPRLKVNIAGASVTLDAGDLRIGAVEIQDNASGIRANVTDLGAGEGALDVRLASTADLTASGLTKEATLLLVKAKTDNLDVLLSTRATEATLATRATEATLLLIKTKTDNLDVLLSTRGTEATLLLIKAKTDNLDVLLSTRATEATLATRATEATLATRAADATVVTIRDQQVQRATAPTIINHVTHLTPGQENSFTLPANTKRFTMKVRTADTVNVAFTAAGSGTLFFTISDTKPYGDDGLNLASQTVYVQSAVASRIIEVVAYT